MTQTVVVGAVQAVTRIHQVDIVVTDALRTELDARFVLAPMPAELLKGIAEPVATYAVREMQGQVGTHARTTREGALSHVE